VITLTETYIKLFTWQLWEPNYSNTTNYCTRQAVNTICMYTYVNTVCIHIFNTTCMCVALTHHAYKEL